MRESLIEARFVRDVHRAGGRCYKWRSVNANGIPDRICVFAHGVIGVAEIKATGEEPTKLQLEVHRELATLGVRVWIIDSYEDVAAFITFHQALASI
jgi:hypothetical protein